MSKNKVEIKKPDFRRWEKAVDDLRIKTGFKVEEIAKETAPVDTGNYRSEINFDGANEVVANAKYSAYIEYGTTGDIVPVNKKALRFVKDGKEVFTKRVKQRKPNPVMRNAAKETMKQIPQMWEQAQKENGLN